MLNKGLVLAGGNLWKHHRKVLNPSFSVGILQQLFPMFDEKAKKLCNRLAREVGKGELELNDFISACSLETLMKGTMAVDRDIISEPLENSYLRLTDL